MTMSRREAMRFSAKALAGLSLGGIKSSELAAQSAQPQPDMSRSIKWLIAGALLSVTSNVFAQSYPTRSIRVIVPYPAGGGADFVARIYAKSLSDSLGQQFAVDNRGGANGNVGSELAAKSPPDGYTLLVTASTNLTINPGLYQKMPFDPQRALAPISILAIQPTILVVHPTLPAATVKELVALAMRRDFTEDEIDTILVDNPRRLLTFV